MDGYTSSSYGDAFADVYDAWYPGLDDTEVTADVVADFAVTAASGAPPVRVLELAVGTGRLALPLARRGLEVHGIDASAAMLDRLHAADRDGCVSTVLGDMVDDLPAGPFHAVLVAYNSLFNLESAARQVACFVAVADRLSPSGAFVVEAFVPEDPPRVGTVVSVRSMTVSEMVLSISDHDPTEQRAHGHLVQFTDGERVRLRPWAVRYAPPGELDSMARTAGLDLVARWEDFERHPFGGDSSRHVSVYALTRAS